jgi:hypothetical protein
VPCDSITTIGVELGKADPGLMAQALRELGHEVTASGTRLYFGRASVMDTATGKTELEKGITVAEIKQAYAAQTVKATAKRYGWQLKEVSKFKFEITKR